MNRLESEIYFPLSKTFPITRNYRDCLLPKTHPWFATAVSFLNELNFFIQENTLEPKEYEIYGYLPLNYSDSKELIISKKGLPFILKINFNRFQPYEATIYRVLLARRCKDFVNRKQLDRIYIPKKFLIPHNLIKKPGDGINGLNHAVIAEKISFAGPNAKKIWKTLSYETRNRQKMQVAYLIFKLGYADSHNENIRLAADGRFAIIDFDEPSKKGYNFFLQLKNSTPKQLTALRNIELERSERGLHKFFLDIHCTKYDQATNEDCFKKSIFRVFREIKKNELHKKCQKIMVQCSNEAKKIRLENLQERVFFICFRKTE